MIKDDLSGEIEGVMRVYEFTKTSFWGIVESVVYLPVLSIHCKNDDGAIYYEHFSINKKGDLFKNPSSQHSFLAECPPKKEWLDNLYHFSMAADARVRVSLKFIEYKKDYEDTSIRLVDTLKMKFKDNKEYTI